MKPTVKTNPPSLRRTCGNCGRLGHNARTCARAARAIDKIGIEIEGWWADLPAAKRRAAELHARGCRDGSLATDTTGETSAWEFQTHPGPLGEATAQVAALYPDKYDRSAGMHIHVSFRDAADASALATEAFATYFDTRWTAWAHRVELNPESGFWPRFRGEVSYCQRNSADDLRDPIRANRYRRLNFAAWSKHKTVEMRMLPLFRDVKLAISAVEEWVAIVEDFLATVAPLTVWGAIEASAEVPAEVGALVETVTGEVEVPDWLAASHVTGEVTLPEILPVAAGHTRVVGPRALNNLIQQTRINLGVA